MAQPLAWLLILLVVASMWRIFMKAGEPGWASIVPIYNVFVIFRIAGLPMWQAGTFVALLIVRVSVRATLGVLGGGMIIGFALPAASAGLWFVACLGLASKFGRGTGFAVGMAGLPFVFYPSLACGSAPYGEPEARETLGLSGA